MKTLKLCLFISFFLSISLPVSGNTDTTGVKPSEATLLRWNLLSCDFMGGHYNNCGGHGEFLGVDFFLPEHRLGIGTALLAAVTIPSDESYTVHWMIPTPNENFCLLPSHIYLILYHSEWKIGKMKFANTINCFTELWLISFHPTINAGFEWCPGTLLNLRIGYMKFLGYPGYGEKPPSAFYFSIGGFLGAINKLGGER